MKKINQNIVMALLFFTILFVIAATNDYNLMKYYVYDVEINNELGSGDGSLLEADYIGVFWNKMKFVNYHGLVKKLLGQQEMNGVIKLDNGYLKGPTDNTDEPIDENTLDSCANSVAGFRDFLAQNDVKYLYVTVPYVVDKYDPQLPVGEEDYGNQNLDAMQERLLARGVDCLDLREAMHADGYETYDLFYRTDHHWTTDGGFYAYQKITEYLDGQYGIGVDEQVMDLDNYSVTTYKSWHLGSAGQRTGIYYAGADDFDLILPNFDTELTRMSDGETGSFEELLIDKGALDTKQYSSRYTYDSVLQNTFDCYHNPNAAVDQTVLVIGDSMSKAVLPYMVLTYRDVLFYSDTSDAQVINTFYLEAYQPDIVISMYFCSQLCDLMTYDFYTGQ